MDLTSEHKPCIINCSVNGWYGAGADRLQRSLLYEGFGGDIRIWKDYPEGCPPHEGDGQYNFKPYCFKEVFDSGVKVAIWCDSSLWCVRNPMPLLDYVNEHGIYLFKSGYLLAETATDRLCEYAGVTREELIQNEVSEFATGLVGINIDNPLGKHFFEQWFQYMKDGMFGGSRVHDLNDSQHPIFKFSREDQSAASMILYKMGVKTAGEDQDFQAYKGTGYNENKILFFIGGL